MNGLYNPEKALQGTGKPIVSADGAGADGGAGAGAGADGAGTDGNKQPGANDAPPVDTKTPDQIAQETAEAQKGMTADEIVADNAKRAEAALTPDQKAEKEAADKKIADDKSKILTEAEDAAMKKILDKLGVKTLDELKNKIPAPPETDEEKAAREQNLKANVAQFAVKNKIMTMDEITSFENLKKQDKREVAYTSFAKEYKETHKGRLDADGVTKVPVTEAEIEDSFNEFFHLNSDNAALKTAGEKQLDAFANSMIKETEEKYNQTVEEYQEYEARKAFFPTFKSFLKEIVASVPAELSFGEGDDKFTFSTKDLDKEAIEKLYSTNAAYDAFYVAKGDQKTRETLMSEFNERLIAKNFPAILKAAHDAGKDIGRKEGSNVGAKQPFEDKKPGGNIQQTDKKPLTAEEYRASQRKYYSGAKSA